MERRMIVKHVISGAETGKQTHAGETNTWRNKPISQWQRGCARTRLNAPLDYSQSQFPPAPIWVSDLKSEQMLTASLFTSTTVYFSGHSSYAVVGMIRYTQRSEAKNNDPNRSNTGAPSFPYGWRVYLCWTGVQKGNFGAAGSDMTVIIKMWGWGVT